MTVIGFICSQCEEWHSGPVCPNREKYANTAPAIHIFKSHFNENLGHTIGSRAQAKEHCKRISDENHGMNYEEV